MTRALVFLIIITTNFSFSQEIIKRDLGDFHKIQTYDLLKVNLIKSDTNKVVISGKFPKNVVVKNKNGELKIRMGVEKRLNGSSTKLDIFYKELYRIEAKEGSFIFSKDTLTSRSLFIKSESGAKITLKTQIQDLTIKSITGGEVVLSGYNTHNEVIVFTGGQVNLKNLENQTSKVYIKAGGLVDVSTKNLLEVDIKAGGIVNIHTKTNKIIEKRILGGEVNYLYNDN
jgi:hypothetical protein